VSLLGHLLEARPKATALQKVLVYKLHRLRLLVAHANEERLQRHAEDLSGQQRNMKLRNPHLEVLAVGGLNQNSAQTQGRAIKNPGQRRLLKRTTPANGKTPELNPKRIKWK
jgi:hypothetical protein